MTAREDDGARPTIDGAGADPDSPQPTRRRPGRRGARD